MNDPSRKLKKLENLRKERSQEASSRKVVLLKLLAEAQFTGPTTRRAKLIARYHDLLLYMMAYPDNEKIRRLASARLRTFESLMSSAIARTLTGSGIVGTKIHYAFEFPIVAWLSRACPNEIEIDWKEFNADGVQKLLPLLTGLSEEPGIEDEEISTKDWLSMAAGKKSALVWIVKGIESLKIPPRMRDHLYDALELPIVIRLAKPAMSRTTSVRASGAAFYHSEPMIRGVGELRAEILRATNPPVILSSASARATIAMSRVALTAREREIYPISHANPADVAVYSLERGLQVVTIGVLPERRMLLEGLWGYLLLKNGVPIGYGCFSCVFESSEIAFNIFDSFRHGEAAVTYAGLLRVIHQHTLASSFSVMKYQFGHDNDEAIKSGAFWFYHKLGFRPFDEKLRARIDRETARLKKRAGSRSDAKTLKNFAKENIYFHLGEENRAVLGNLSYAKSGHVVTAALAAGAEDRSETVRNCRKSVEAALGRAMPRSELADEFSLLLARMEDLPSWPTVDKNALAGIVEAKSGKSERDFVLRMNAHARLKRTVLALL